MMSLFRSMTLTLLILFLISQLTAIHNDQSLQHIRETYLRKEQGEITSEDFEQILSEEVQVMRNEDPIIQLTSEQKETMLNGNYADFFNSPDSDQQHRSPRQTSISRICPPLPSNGNITVVADIWGDVYQVNFEVKCT